MSNSKEQQAAGDQIVASSEFGAQDPERFFLSLLITKTNICNTVLEQKRVLTNIEHEAAWGRRKVTIIGGGGSSNKVIY